MGEFEDEEAVSMFIRTAMASKPDLAMVPAQDLLDLGTEARMNYPGILGGNWQWRMTAEQMTALEENAPELRTLLEGCERA